MTNDQLLKIKIHSKKSASIFLLAFIAYFLFSREFVYSSPDGQEAETIKKAYEEEKYRAYKDFVGSEPGKKESIEEKLREYQESLAAAYFSFEKMPPAVLNNSLGQKRLPPLRMDTDELEKVSRFLRGNLTQGGLPLSYKTTHDYWKMADPFMDEVDATMERLLLGHSLSIYDASVWQIALAIADWENTRPLLEAYGRRLISGRSGELQDIRAYDDPFRYGDQKVRMKRENAYFFRIISDRYFQSDPKDGKAVLPGFPNNPELHHEDWKPITGEQAWAAIIGPLQVAFVKYHSRIPLGSEEVNLALSILPAIETMQSPMGAIYHAPHGTYEKDPHDISNENNFSLYAALRMLYEVVKNREGDAAWRIQRILRGQENYFKHYVFDKDNGIFYQGGYYVEGKFVPNRIYAVDAQTWGTIVLGQAWIDKEFGDGTAFKIWQNVKKHAGYFDEEGVLKGVGFTDGYRINSVEWTCGAILNATLLARDYKISHPERSKILEADAVSMRHGVEELKVTLEDDSEAYLYSNQRSFIPFGWWANPIPSLVSTAWVILIDKGFNPFILGG